MITTPKFKQTKVNSVSWKFESDNGDLWLAVKDGTQYDLMGDDYAEFVSVFGIRALRSLDDVRAVFKRFLAWRVAVAVDAKYPDLAEAFSEAHYGSNIDGHGDEGAGYDHFQAIQSFMESDEMRAYLAAVRRGVEE